MPKMRGRRALAAFRLSQACSYSPKQVGAPARGHFLAQTLREPVAPAHSLCVNGPSRTKKSSEGKSGTMHEKTLEFFTGLAGSRPRFLRFRPARFAFAGAADAYSRVSGRVNTIPSIRARFRARAE